MTKLINNLQEIDDREGWVLANIQSIKLRHNPLSDVTISPFIGLILRNSQNLKRLDLSFTSCHRPTFLIKADRDLAIEKLLLTSTNVQGKDVVSFISRLPRLKYLGLGALGAGAGASLSMLNSSAMTLSDNDLRALSDALLVTCPLLERVDLVQNTKLGLFNDMEDGLSSLAWAKVRFVGGGAR